MFSLKVYQMNGDIPSVVLARSLQLLGNNMEERTLLICGAIQLYHDLTQNSKSGGK